MMSRIGTAAFACIASAAVLAAGRASGSPSPEPAPFKAPAPGAAPKEPPKPPAQPNLDELLGTAPPPPPTASPAHGPVDPSRSGPGTAIPNADRVDLERALTGEELADAFKKAVALMGDAAARLDTHRDAGIQTQRLQEEALANLVAVLNSLQKQSGSRSSPSRPKPNSDPSSQPRPQPQQSRSQPASTPNMTGDPNAPTLKQGALNDVLDSARASWGALPERVRDMLLQGSGDRFSSTYQRLTEEYYRRLAQEAGSKP